VQQGCGTRSWRLSIGSGGGIFFDSHAEFVKGAGVFCIFGRDTFRDRLGAFKLRAGIEKSGTVCSSAIELALGTRAIGSNPGVRTAPQLAHRARVTVPTMRRCAGAELVGAARTAGGRLAVGDLSFLSVFPRRGNRGDCTFDPQRPPSARFDGLPQLQPVLTRCRACQLGLYPIGLLHSVGPRNHSLEFACRNA